MRFRGDTPFFLAVLALTIVGFFIFTSASMGLLARSAVSLSGIAFSQIFLGLFGGGICLFVAYHIPVAFWKRYAFYIFLATLLLSLAVFIPGIGFSHGGATRWIDLRFVTFQPAEFLKLGAVIYTAAWFSGMRRKAGTFSFGVAPVSVILCLVGLILLIQPDTDTFAVLALTVLIMWYVAGATYRHLVLIGCVGIGLFLLVALARPYIMDRLMTYFDPTRDALGSSYQIQQSLIAIGSGQLTGRGFGRSIQKYTFLPEPIGDSIFAVAAEEFGFIGSVIIIGLFLFLIFRGFRIAIRAPDTFARLLVVGIVILIVAQSFINIASMLNIIPLVGTPLLFVSQGGTALFTTLVEAGIVLAVSKKHNTT